MKYPAFPEIEAEHGENPARFLYQCSPNRLTPLAKARLRGIDDLDLARCWLDVEKSFFGGRYRPVKQIEGRIAVLAGEESPADADALATRYERVSASDRVDEAEVDDHAGVDEPVTADNESSQNEPCAQEPNVGRSSATDDDGLDEPEEEATADPTPEPETEPEPEPAVTYDSVEDRERQTEDAYQVARSFTDVDLIRSRLEDERASKHRPHVIDALRRRLADLGADDEEAESSVDVANETQPHASPAEVSP
jgi:hypothetical protein